MGLDIRLPIGLMFGIIGLLLTGYGLIGDKSIYARSLGINVNLWWGLAMVVFAFVMLGLARRGGPTMRPADESAEGEATERREHDLGLEHEPPRGH
jgi:hypothetical protein